MQIVIQELNPFRPRLASSFRQHPFRKVECSYDSAGPRQPEGMPASATAKIKYGQSLDIANRFPYEGLFQRQKRVCVAIVDHRPAIVVFADSSKQGAR